jgi:hypothetical protein
MKMDVFNKEPEIKFKEILPRVFHIEFKNQLEITSTLMRFQEYFESPKFKNKIFTIKEYVKWYTDTNGKFSYFTDWNGFNFPSSVLKPFYDKKFKTLTKREKAVLNLFKNVTGKFYIIGTHEAKKKDLSLIRHEIAHALYYTDKEYRDSVNAILENVDTSPINGVLARFGYHKSVFLDEVHAYLSTGYDNIEDFVDMNPYKNVIKKLEKNFSEIYNRKTSYPKIIINEYEF